jgi:hypothetical protein
MAAPTSDCKSSTETPCQRRAVHTRPQSIFELARSREALYRPLQPSKNRFISGPRTSGAALEIMELVRETLHDATLDLDGHRLFNLWLEFSEAMYDDRNEAHHGLLRFRTATGEVGQ